MTTNRQTITGHAGWCVIKFGGTSVSGRPQWETIEGVVHARLAAGFKVLVVCSAASGVTNTLENILKEATTAHGAQALVDGLVGLHMKLGTALGVDAELLLADLLGDVRRVAAGVGLLGEASPKVHARLLASGELMSTRLGAAFMKDRGLDAKWIDARTLLKSDESGVGGNDRRSYLSAVCGFAHDAGLRAALDAMPERVLITQGFIASNGENETVLLGRGGSDTSAAYFAAKLGAAVCEIWTDVPGMFSANPRQIPQARFLKSLDYDEAQEIASTGAKVLHPRCLPPVRAHNIPMLIGCTQRPDMEGTQITAGQRDRAPRVKAISARTGLTLLSMETLGMWQEVGFLADVFVCFKARGLSVDLVSTSETNVTVSLDPLANVLDNTTLEALVGDLEKYCRVRVIQSAAAVSLVGRQIRACLHKLGPVLSLFEEQRVYLVTQAASDLNLTFVVDESQVDRLVRELHALLFNDQTENEVFGPSWQAMFPSSDGAGAQRSGASPVLPWWVKDRERLVSVAQTQSPAYVYSEAELKMAAQQVKQLRAIDRSFYAMKANNNPDVLRCLRDAGMGFECVSLAEVEYILTLFPQIARQEIFFTPNFAPRSEYEGALRLGVNLTLDNLHPLEAWPELFSGREIFVRLDPGQGRGHHAHVKTAGAKAKFGISAEQLDALVQAVERSGARVIGLHAHTGSGVRQADNWQQTALFLAQVAQSRLPSVRILNLGGGLGVPEKAGEASLDLKAVDDTLTEFKKAFPSLSLWLEPGRFLVARAGVLLARVTQTKRKGDANYVGVDAGMNSLIRPALYGAFHEIVNLSRLNDAPTQQANIVGPICESGDTLGYNRLIAPASEGDVLLIDTAGAYGYVMGSNYNMRSPAREVFLSE